MANRETRLCSQWTAATERASLPQMCCMTVHCEMLIRLVRSTASVPVSINDNVCKHFQTQLSARHCGNRCTARRLHHQGLLFKMDGLVCVRNKAMVNCEARQVMHTTNASTAKKGHMDLKKNDFEQKNKRKRKQLNRGRANEKPLDAHCAKKALACIGVFLCACVCWCYQMACFCV